MGSPSSSARRLRKPRPTTSRSSCQRKQRRGRIFLDFLRNQRTATAVLPYSARARAGSPVAALVGWDELARIERADHFTILDAGELIRRAGQRSLRGWGIADQRLPRLS